LSAKRYHAPASALRNFPNRTFDRTAIFLIKGSSVAESFARNTSARIVALADLFSDNLAAGQDRFNKLNASLGQSPIESQLREAAGSDPS
jgi:hypothetical protein